MYYSFNNWGVGIDKFIILHILKTIYINYHILKCNVKKNHIYKMIYIILMLANILQISLFISMGLL